MNNRDSNRERGSKISGSRSNSPDSQEGEQLTLNGVESNGENQEAFSRSSSTSDESDNNKLSNDFEHNNVSNESVKEINIKGNDINDGNTLLRLALDSQPINWDKVRLLVKNKADVNTLNNDGNTLLHLAVRKSSLITHIVPRHLVAIGKENILKLIKFLIGRGANVNALNKDGFTALDLARGQGVQEFIEFLENAGQSLNKNNEEKRNSSLEQRNSAEHNDISEKSTNGDMTSSGTKRSRTSDGSTQKPPVKKVAQSDSPRQEVKIKSSVGNDESDEQQDSNRERGSKISGSRSNSPDSQEGEQLTLNDAESNGENQEAFSSSSSTSDKNDNNNLSEESKSWSSVDVRDNIDDDNISESEQGSACNKSDMFELCISLISGISASENQLLEKVKHFVKIGGNINLTSKDNMTLLHLACKNGYWEVANIL